MGSFRLTLEQFLDKANKIHNNFFDYSKAIYINNKKNINIICPLHGDYWQRPDHHLMGSKCPSCSNVQRINTDKFIEKANGIHYNKYNYSKVKYINAKTKVCIICPKHGEFWQIPLNHVNEKKGCLNCKESIGEKAISIFLIENNIKFERQKKFEECKNERILFFDFYLPKYNILIEFDGRQHYMNEVSWGKNYYNIINIRDNIKNNFAKNNNIKLLRIPFWKKSEINLILKKELIL